MGLAVSESWLDLGAVVEGGGDGVAVVTSLEFILIAVHSGVDEGFFGDESLIEEAAEVGVPLDVAGAADDVFERAGSAVVVGDGAGDGVIVVLEELVGENPALDAVEKALRVDEDEDFRQAAEHRACGCPSDRVRGSGRWF